MLTLTFPPGAERPLQVLCLGAHSDDIEIGCGGTILRLTGEFPDLDVVWVVLSGSATRAAEARCSAERFLARAGRSRLIVQDFKDGFFPYIGAEVKTYFESLKGQVSPDIIFTHYRHDRHQDHRLVSELTWNTFRDHLILEYEIPKYDGDLGSPNYFVRLDEPLCRMKADYLIESFPSQRQKPWFTRDTFLALMRLRGMEARAPGRYAEGFYAHKLVQ